MVDKSSSDEKLLKLIEGGAGRTELKQNIGIGHKKSLSGIMPTVKFRLNLKDIKSFKLNLPIVNKGLVAASVIGTLVFFYSLLSGPHVSASSAAYYTSADVSGISKILLSKDEAGLSRKKAVSQDIRRNMFLPPGKKYNVAVDTSGPDLVEISKDLKLVGIIWSATPEVMIEYAKDSRTYTLKKGDTFNGDQFKVKDISRNSALLEVSENGNKSEYVLR